MIVTKQRADIIDCLRADSRFALGQWETALLCNDFSHWLGTSLGSALLSVRWRLELTLGFWASFQYRTSFCVCNFRNKDKTGMRPSYLYNRYPNIGNVRAASLSWDTPPPPPPHPLQSDLLLIYVIMYRWWPVSIVSDSDCPSFGAV